MKLQIQLIILDQRHQHTVFSLSLHTLLVLKYGLWLLSVRLSFSYRLRGLCTGSEPVLPRGSRCWRWARWRQEERRYQPSPEKPLLTLQYTHTHLGLHMSWCWYETFPCSCLSSCFTFHVERRSAGGSAVVVLGLTVIDGSVLGEHLDQQQRVLVAIVEELALEACRQSLGVFVPEDLRLRNTAHLYWEASRFTRLHRLGLHVDEDLRRLRDWTRQKIHLWAREDENCSLLISFHFNVTHCFFIFYPWYFFGL